MKRKTEKSLDGRRCIVAYLDSFSLTRDLRQARLVSLPAHAFGRLQSATGEELDALSSSQTLAPRCVRCSAGGVASRIPSVLRLQGAALNGEL